MSETLILNEPETKYSFTHLHYCIGLDGYVNLPTEVYFEPNDLTPLRVFST